MPSRRGPTPLRPTRARPTPKSLCLRPTWAEVDTERWRTALFLAVDRLPAGLRAEVGPGRGNGPVPGPDRHGLGRPSAAPRHSTGRRSTAELRDLRARGLDRAIERVAGGEPTPGTLPALSYLWLSSNEPEVDVRARWFGHGTTWLGAWLTGQIAIDASNASMTGLYDTCRRLVRCSDGRASHRSGALASHSRESGRPIGGLRPEVAGLLGLPVGTPVTLAGAIPRAPPWARGVPTAAGASSPAERRTRHACAWTSSATIPASSVPPMPPPERGLAWRLLYTGGALDWCGRLLSTASEDPAELCQRWPRACRRAGEASFSCRPHGRTVARARPSGQGSPPWVGSGNRPGRGG